MRRTLSLGFVFLLVAGFLAVLAPAPPASAAGQISVYMSGLQFPIALGFASDGRIFYAERNTGNIRIIQGGLLLVTPYITLPNTTTAGERGLLGLALDPGYPSTPFVYAYQTYNDALNGTIYNRILRIVGGGNVATSFTVILRMPPLSGATNHNGGVIAFGPDGKLYADVGENADMALSQDLTSPMGKVLRMNTDGTAPTDNPYYGSLSTNNLIYTYGHRNMFGLAFHPFTGRLYVTENGPNCNDEINLLPNLTAADRNFGWGPTANCATPPPAPINTNRDGPNPILPIWWWAGTICPTNAAIYGGPFFPAFRGDMFMGDCNFNRFHRLHLVPPNYDTVASDTIVWTAPASIIEVEQGRDGAIWITTPSTIYRYWDSAQPPVPAFTATPNPVAPGTPVAFDASASSDPDGTIVSYSWTFGDLSTGSGVTTSHAYAAVGTYTVTLTIVDNESYSRNTSHDVTVRLPPQPPVASFTANPNVTTPGTVVAFDATASYDPDGTIVSYSWTFGDTLTGSGVTTGHAYAAVGTYRVTLTVVDNSSSSANTSQDVVVRPPPASQPPVASFTASPNPVAPGSPVAFDASLSYDPDGTIVLYSWNFGDLSNGTGVTTTHAYAASGTYTAILTVVDNASLSTNASQAVIVDAPPVARFTYAPAAVYINVVIAFDGSSSSDPDGPVVSWTWDFGDGATGSGVTATHTYAWKGPFTVALTVGDPRGVTDRTTRILTVGNRAPRILSSDPGLGPVVLGSGVNRTFSVLAWDPDGDVLTYSWRVDGVAVGGNASAFDFLRAPGVHTVNVTVSDGSLATSREWAVTVSPPGGEIPAYALPFIAGLLLGVVLMLLILFVWWRRRKPQDAPRTLVEAPPPPPAAPPPPPPP